MKYIFLIEILQNSLRFLEKVVFYKIGVMQNYILRRIKGGFI